LPEEIILEKSDKIGILDRVWRFFSSLKLAIVLLLVIAVTSIIGTIVEQTDDPAKTITFLTGIFGENAAPTVYNIFVKLDFMDMYHSWWFITLLALFCVNLTVCSLEKIPKTWRVVKSPIHPLAENVIRSLPIKREVTFHGAMAAVRDTFTNAMRASRFPVLEATDEAPVLQLYSQKGAYSRLGVYVVHLSILLIFAGAIIGLELGYDGYLNLPEGRSSSVVYKRPQGVVPLDFTIHLNWYETRYYPGTDTPLEFESELVILEDGREVLKTIIEVNSPLTYKGITFYQSSYGMLDNAMGEFFLNVSQEGGPKESLRLLKGETFHIPGSDVKGTILDFSPALGRDPMSGELTTYSETMVNPAVLIEFESGSDEEKKTFSGWILKRYPDTGLLPGGYRVEFLDYWGVEYTGLQVSKDPGVVLIYIACVIMAAGLYMAFFMSHKKIWIRLNPGSSGKKGSVHMLLAGSASKNRLAFEKEVDKILSKVSQTVEGRHSAKNLAKE
jgi:cytochrome c biogenesis protein